MKIFWTDAALNQLEAIRGYLAQPRLIMDKELSSVR